MKPIQLYSLATPNGQKISVALEELELPYQAITVNILKGEQFTAEFIAKNPNSKIPVIVDPNGPNGEEITIMESGAILLYLAEKTGRLLSDHPIERMETIQWLFFQMASIGPMFGQFGHFFKYAGDRCTHPYPLERYQTEAIRLLKVLDQRLEGRNYLVGEQYSIADIAIFPWVECLRGFYKASKELELESFHNVLRWLEKCLARPKTEDAMRVCSDI